MARRATLIDTLRAHNPNLLLYDAGSFASKHDVTGLPVTQFIVRTLDRLGYTAITLGPRELVYGLDAFPLEGRLPILLTNLYVREDGKLVPAGRRYTIDEVGGIRVGTFSLLTRSIPQRVEKRLGDFEVRDPAETAREMIDFFESENVDVIVLLSQLARTTADAVLPDFPEIDVVILGHDSTPFTGRPDTWAAASLYGTNRGQAVASAEITLGPDGEKKATEKHMHDLHAMMRFEPEIAALVDEMDVEMRRLLDADKLERLKKAHERARANDTVRSFVGAESCGACHTSEHETWSHGPHAHAFQTLVDLGVQSSQECLRCHTVGYGEATGFESADGSPDLGGVQCESCHGMGSEHYDAAATADAAALCVRCHDAKNSPDFELADYLARIRHW